MDRRWIFPVLFGFSGLASCGQKPAQVAEEPRPTRRVTAVKVRRQAIERGYRASGTVRGHATATLTAKALGHVKAVYVTSGQLVRAGQLLVELEANDVRASVARARASMQLAVAGKLEAENALKDVKSNAELALTNQGRSEQLFEQGAISRQALDEAQNHQSSASAQEQVALARVAAADSNIQATRAALAEAEALLGYTKLEAPFNGRVLERSIDPGALASPGTPLLVLADDGALRVEAMVPETYASKLKVGDFAQLELEGKPLKEAGKVSEVVANVDARTRTFLAKVDLPPGAGDYAPGTFARVTFPSNPESRLMVPDSALDRYGALERVFVVSGGRAQLRMVTTGEHQASWATVLTGLDEGEDVVASATAELRDSDPVQVDP